MALSGTWLYVGNHRVLGGTGSSPSPDTAAERAGHEGILADRDSGLQFTEVSWTTNANDTAFPLHHKSQSSSHFATYDIGDGPVTSRFASFLHYRVQLTFLRPDGTTFTRTEVFTVRQTVNGDTFVTPSADFGDPYETFDYPLVSIQLVQSEATNWNMQMVGVRDFTPGGELPPPIVCFMRGTLLDVPDGQKAIEDLQKGDLVLTRDNGAQPIRWIGSTVLTAAMLRMQPDLRPVRIAAEALGAGIPSRDLLVSPQHRVLVRSRIAQRMFGCDEVLVAAKQLLELNGVEIAGDVDEVEYFHILFDQHEIVTSNGADTESLYTGPVALRSVPAAARQEILTLFPDLATDNPAIMAVRPLSSGRQGRQLAARHKRNNQPLVI